MASSNKAPSDHVVVDSIHGDIHLNDTELAVIDTGSFQRLRQIKQLGMGHVTYPNATHTRFAHSLGTLGIMERVVKLEGISLDDKDKEDIRLAALLHDVGHYPYSHLMENIDNITLTEERVNTKKEKQKTVASVPSPYPDHEEVGRLIVTRQKDMLKAIGSKERAERIADIFTRTGVNTPHISRLVHSSLDLDRLDYLLRDSHSAGVPYGKIDINYILNNMKVSPKGMVGVTEKALPAAEHVLFARFFMHRTVYYHKTTFGIEVACKQLLKRLRDANKFGIPSSGKAIRECVQTDRLGKFTDALVDNAIHKTASMKDSDCDDSLKVAKALAQAIKTRKPPKLIKEFLVLDQKHDANKGTLFVNNCIHGLEALSKEVDIPLGQFLLCQTKPLRLESRAALLTVAEARNTQPEEEDDLIKVFVDNEEEPRSLIEIDNALVKLCANHSLQASRLYVVYQADDRDEKLAIIKNRVAGWSSS